MKLLLWLVLVLSPSLAFAEPDPGSVIEIAKGQPWYIVLAAAAFGAVWLIFSMWKSFRKDQVDGAVDESAGRAVKIYDDLSARLKQSMLDMAAELKDTNAKLEATALELADSTNKLVALRQDNSQKDETIRNLTDKLTDALARLEAAMQQVQTLTMRVNEFERKVDATQQTTKQA